MAEVHGRFVEAQSHTGESLTLEFSCSVRPIDQRWRNGRISADYLAQVSEAFFPIVDAPRGEKNAALRHSINYAAGELIENALKYSYQPAKEGHRITLQPHAAGARLYLSNRVDPSCMDDFRWLIGRLLSQCPADLYEQQVLRNAESDAPHQSRLGLVTLADAHGAILAWKFDSTDPPERGILVTTMVSLEL